MNNQDTPETNAMASMRRTTKEWIDHSEKLERERNEWKISHDHVCRELAACENARDENAALCEEARKDVEKANAHKRVLKTENNRLRQAIRETLMENLHLADGDICTLKRLKDAIGFELPETEITP